MRAILILGMHRSGTSCLTGLLEQAGVFLGNVSRKNLYNLKGNHENPRIMNLHDELLKRKGGSWQEPPEVVVWPKDLKKIRDEIIRDYAGKTCWGFKDPRTLLVLEGWMEVILSLQLVGIYRHPLLVAESLLRRDKFSIEKGLSLWARYNEKLLTYYKKYHFPIISFDNEPFSEKFSQLCKLLGLLTGVKTDFFDPRLRRAHSSIDIALPEKISQLYLELENIAL
ncbi:MAG: hypothetical protein A2Y97_14385 [Nitrospirae bacterium RBG_13_39_12]|nr:MAG: hypothetical protein A2Y97_14385 [Nitrospirae bacterium RBG_13_39_12]